ncbi:ACP S-malonyltransferase [Pseudoramibacter sp.]|uniref:ACP S-malonyltransferase n=1 Tax=Pseudoramibacter sp. TaxID=2034862 RepID=UPI0025EFE49B|nr:ACP S-malonyltransferase [Pseudoramibacter sp.]MCH4072271.1 ACP S-malonyltransferase [Pseudoramibacter sp.]MCH4106041.1 ACP S-malonyltransferase [Pseudoramibacter sp.]
MKLAFLYAGQGAQHVGMGRDLYEKYPAFASVFDHAELPFDLKKLCFEGPEETLSQTQYTQPAMVAFAIGVTNVLKEAGIVPDMACGLSLGEYSALYAAGVWDAPTTLDLIAFRGQAMADASKGLDVGMAAVLGLSADQLGPICKDASDGDQKVEMANFNCPGQIVISGDAQGVQKASEAAKAAGAKRVIPLKVSGPFHTSYMKPAGDALAKKFETLDFRALQFPVLFNAIGDVKPEDQSIADLLVKQVQQSVYLEQSIRKMAEMGADTFVEIGPGKAMSGFVRKTIRGTKPMKIDTADDLDAVIQKLSK